MRTGRPERNSSTRWHPGVYLASSTFLLRTIDQEMFPREYRFPDVFFHHTNSRSLWFLVIFFFFFFWYLDWRFLQSRRRNFWNLILCGRIRNFVFEFLFLLKWIFNLPWFFWIKLRIFGDLWGILHLNFCFLE